MLSRPLFYAGQLTLLVKICLKRSNEARLTATFRRAFLASVTSQPVAWAHLLNTHGAEKMSAFDDHQGLLELGVLFDKIKDLLALLAYGVVLLVIF